MLSYRSYNLDVITLQYPNLNRMLRLIVELNCNNEREQTRHKESLMKENKEVEYRSNREKLRSL